MNNTRRSTRREVKVVSFSFLFLFFGLCTVVSVCVWLESAHFRFVGIESRVGGTKRFYLLRGIDSAVIIIRIIKYIQARSVNIEWLSASEKTRRPA